jgi:hypothetical protein
VISLKVTANMSFQERCTSWMAQHIVATITLSIVGLYSLYWTITTFIQYRKLAHIKGPWIAAISPAWLFYHTLRGDNYLAVEAALKKYGRSVAICRTRPLTARLACTDLTRHRRHR